MECQHHTKRLGELLQRDPGCSREDVNQAFEEGISWCRVLSRQRGTLAMWGHHHHPDVPILEPCLMKKVPVAVINIILAC